MLRVNQLVGFGSGGNRPIEVIQADSDTDATSLTTYSLTCDIGAAESGRTVFVLVAAEENTNTGRTISSMTVNGVSASEVVGIEGGASSDTQLAGIWAAQVPTGSGNQTVSITFSGGMDGVAVETVACRYVSSLTATATVTDTVAAGTVLMNSTIAVGAGGMILAVAHGASTTETATWVELTESLDADVTAVFSYSTARDLYAIADSAVDPELAWSSSTDGAAVAAAIR